MPLAGRFRYASFLSKHNMRVLAAAFVALVLIGCEDPSNVGLGLIGEEGGDPIRVHLTGSDLPAERVPLITGSVLSASVFLGPERFLFGIADDPLFGMIEAKGYIDFQPPLLAGASFRSGNITSVQLFLASGEYVFGDTLANANMTLTNMDVAWAAIAVRSDTTLDVGTVAHTFDYVYKDSTLVIDMPDVWIAEYESRILDVNFVDLFHGFEISAATASAVSGFDASDSFMRVITTTGSGDYRMSKLLTTLTKTGGLEASSGQTAIQDGFGDNAVLDFNFEVDSLAGSAISRVVVNVSVDLAAYDDAPAHFVRPLPQRLDLIGIRENGTRRLLRSASIGEDGSVSFVSTTASAGEFTIVRSVQRAVTGSSQFEKYAVTIVESQAAIGAALIDNSASESGGPDVIITLVPSPF